MADADANTRGDGPISAEPPGILQTLIAVVFGFFTFAATLTICVVIVGLVLGEEFAYQGTTWRTSVGMDAVVLLAGALGAFMGGAVSRPVGGSPRTTPIFAAAMLITVVAWLALRHSAAHPDGPRSAAIVGMNDGHSLAVAGPVALYGLPIVACLMAYAGGSLANRIQRAFFGR